MPIRYRKKYMRILLVLFTASAPCSSSLAMTQDVGGDFGKLWIEQHGAQPFNTGSKNSLWNWGSAPQGYMAINGKLYLSDYEVEYSHQS